jgi:transcriptional regulator with XRE-family HTH domain
MYQVAGAAHIHSGLLSEYSRGQKEIPPHHLMALAEVLDVPPDDLVGVVDDGELEGF